MDNSENTQYTYKKLQEMLPDYVFNRLNEEDKNFFEANVQNFDDLVQEVKDAQEVFRRVEATKFDDYFNRKTQNLSVKVNQRLNTTYNQRYYRFMYKYVMPSIGLITIAVLLFFSDKLFPPKNIEIKKEPLIQLTEPEKEEIFSAILDTTEEKINLPLENIASTNIFEQDSQISSDFDEFIDDFYADLLLNYINEDLIQYISNEPTAIYTILQYINSINEEDFQQILEEIENEKINI